MHVQTSHAFAQAAGYLKHNLAKTESRGVFFRGQSKVYSTLPPSLFRNIGAKTNDGKRRAKMEAFLSRIDSEAKALRAVDPKFREGLLQHYGIRTTWLDVVDNIWVALWFACHEAKASGRHGEFLHFEKRRPSIPGNEFAYVLLVKSAIRSPNGEGVGHFSDTESETLDLRIAVPSHFVRPHAQHGLVIRGLSRTRQPLNDYAKLLVGVIRVSLVDALDWLGNAATLSIHSIFPPAFYDYGYRELLDNVNPGDKQLGAIHHVQP